MAFARGDINKLLRISSYKQGFKAVGHPRRLNFRYKEKQNIRRVRIFIKHLMQLR